MTLEQQSAEAKSARLLDLYARFISGQTLNKQDLASEYGVTTRSIQRDMESLRCFLMEKGLSQEIIYDRRHGLSNGEQRSIRLNEQRDFGCLQNSVGKPLHAAG